MFIIFFIVAAALLAIPVSGAVGCFRSTGKDRELTWVFVVMTAAMLVIIYGIFGQLKTQEEFANKCEASNGMVIKGQCINKDAVITIER